MDRLYITDATDMGNLEAKEGGMLIGFSAEERMGKPEELGYAIATVADERNGYLAGVDVLVDGGSVTGKEFVKNKKTLDQYTQDDFKLIFCVGSAPIYNELDEDNYGCISFTTEPTANKEHTLTITIKDDYGRTFSDTTTVKFK